MKSIRRSEKSVFSRKTKNTLLASTMLTAAGLMAFAAPAKAIDINTTPDGEQVTSGAADFDRPDESTLNIHQHSDRVSINWEHFNIGSNALTEFFQPSAHSLAVNRVVGSNSDPTKILGTLRANGRVMVIDANGVFFGADSVVDVGAIIVSTGDLSDADINDGDDKFEFSNFGDGKIELNGTVTVAEAGLAAFVSPFVSNSGIINAKLGKVAFAAGDKVTLDLYGDELVEIAVNDKIGDALLENSGLINAEGGNVIMTAQAAKQAVDNVINMNGVVNVSSVEVQGGKIILKGGEQGVVKVGGTLNASGEGGGEVDVKGQNIIVDGTIHTDGGKNGNGGRVEIIADNAAIFEGQITAKGGDESGDGGFVEVSGLNHLIYEGSVDTTAAFGETGMLLLDPTDVNIIGGTADGSDTANVSSALLGTVAYATTPSTFNIYESEIEGQSATSNITIQATHNISTSLGTSADGVVTLANNRNLTIQTRNDNVVAENNGALNLSNLAFVTSGTGTITVQASTGSGTGNITVGNLTSGGNMSITTDSGSITVGGILTANNNASVTLDSGAAGITTGGGNFVVSAGGGVTISDALTTLGGSVDVDADGLITMAGINAAGGNIDVKTTDGGMGANGPIVTTGTGTVRLEAEDDLSIGTSGGITTGGGKVTLKAGTGGSDEIIIDSDITTNGGAAEFTAHEFSTDDDDDVISTGGGNVSIIADVVELAGDDDPIASGKTVINAGSGTVSIERLTDGDISLGSATGGLNLAQDEIAAITAANLTIGGNHTSSIDVKNVNTTIATISGLVTLNTGVSLGNDDDVTFEGTNVFNALEVNSDDDIVFKNNASVETKTGDAKFYGDTNDASVGDFEMGQGSALKTNGHNVDIGVLNVHMDDNSSIKSTGGNIHVFTSDDFGGGLVTIDAGALIDADGGNIDIDNEGIFFSANADSVKTKGTGTIDINQWAGGSIQNAVDAVANSGTGLNTIHVGPGTFNENVLVYEDNFYLEGANHGIDPNTGVRVPETLIQDLTGPDGAAYGFKVTSNNVTIDGFQINTDGRGVALEGGAGGKSGFDIKNNIIATLSVQDAIDAGVYGHNAGNATVHNNKITPTDNHGIEWEGGDSVNINNNVISSTLAGYDGIHALNITNLVIDTNTINSIGDDGIDVAGSAGAQILNNQIGLTGGAGNIAGDGITVVDSASAQINNNQIQNVLGNGIFADPSPNTVITYNTIINAALNGIYVLNSDNVSVGVTYGIGVVPGNQGEGGNYISNSGLNGIEISGGTNILIGNNTVAGAVANGIYVHDTDTAYINTNEIYDVTGGNGIALRNVTTLANVYYNLIHDVSGDGIFADNITDLEVTSNGIGYTDIYYANTPDTAGSIGGDGIDVENSADAKIQNNLIQQVGGNGIYLDPSDGAAISGNTIDYYVLNGIWVDNSDWVQVLNNSVGQVDGGFSSISGDAILVSNGSDHAKVDGNTVTTDGRGISLLGGDGHEVSNNTITTISWFNSADEGIYADSTSNANIHDNHITSADNAGIRISGGSNATVNHNDIHAATEQGIDIESVITANVTNNLVENTFSDGIYANNTTGLSITGNIIHNTGDDGIDVNNSPYAYISGNYVGYSDAGITPGAANNIAGDGIQIIDSDYAGAYNNYIINVVGNGIFVDPSQYVDAWYNNIQNAGLDGINAVDAFEFEAYSNYINTVGDDGIDATNSFGVDLWYNNINNAVDDGIAVTDSAFAWIYGNTINTVGGDGIFIDPSDDTEVNGNTINFAAAHAVNVDNSDRVKVINNTIGNLDGGQFGSGSGDGIHVANGSDDAFIDNNTITTDGRGVSLLGGDSHEVSNNTITTISWVNSSDEGIYAESTTNANIHDNHITAADNHGISAYLGSNLTVNHNDIHASTWNGINIESIATAGVHNNYVENVYQDGIYVGNTSNLGITGNTIHDAFDDGIDVYNSAGANIAANDIGYLDSDNTTPGNPNNIGGDGIALIDSAGSNIHNNSIINVAGNGIFVDPSPNTTVNGNIIANAGLNGIYVLDSDNVDVTNNYVNTTGLNGILVLDSNENYVYGNTVSNANIDGIHVENFDTAWIGYNHVNFTGDDGIEAVNGGFVSIYDNYILGAGFYSDNADYYGADGIHVRNVWGIIPEPEEMEVLVEGFGYSIADADSQIFGNTVAFTVDDGIEVIEGNRTYIFDNTVGHVGYNTWDADGIRVVDTDHTIVKENRVADVLGDGIRVKNGAYAGVFGNKVLLAGDDGIEVSGINWSLEIPAADVDYPSYGWAVNVEANDVAMVGDNGIYVHDSNATRIVNNDVFMTGLGGVVYDNVNGVAADFAGESEAPLVSSFFFFPWFEKFGLEWGNGDGINVYNVHGYDESGDWSVLIQGNDIAWTGGDGIDVSYSGRTLIGGEGEGEGNTTYKSGIDFTKYFGFASFDELVSEGPFASEDRRNLWPESDLTDLLASYVPFPYVVEFDTHDGIHVNNVTTDGIYYFPGTTGGGSYDGYAVHIINNDVDVTGDDGIQVKDSSSVLISGNEVTNAGAFYGFSLDAGSYHGADGINVQNVYGEESAPLFSGFGFSGYGYGDEYAVVIKDNTVDHTADDGIEVDGAGRTLIKNNSVHDAGAAIDYEDGAPDGYGADGIHVRDVSMDDEGMSYGFSFFGFGDKYAVNIIGNTVDHTGDDGIEVIDSESVKIARNDVTDAGNGSFWGYGGDYYGADGIHVRNINGAYDDDYYSVEAKGFGFGFGSYGNDQPKVLIEKNTVETTGDDGIEVAGVDGRVEIKRNTITDAGVDRFFGFPYYAGHGDGYGADGIHVRDVYDDSEGSGYGFGFGFGFGFGHGDDYAVEITGNSIDTTGDDGIEVIDSESVSISWNDTEHNGQAGKFGWGYGGDYYGADGIHVRNVYGDDNILQLAGFGYGYGDDDEYAVSIKHNDVNKTGDDGIEVAYAGRTLIGWNDVSFAGVKEGYWGNSYAGHGDYYGADGIHVRGVSNNSVYDLAGGESDGGFYGYAVDIIGNTVETTGDDGIEVINSESTLISDNNVQHAGVGGGYYYGGGDYTGADGIHVANVYGDYGYGYAGNSEQGEFTSYAVVIKDNYVDTSADDGIEVVESGRTLIKDNEVYRSGYDDSGESEYDSTPDGWGHDGIHVRDVYAHDYYGYYGYYEGGYDVEVIGNIVDMSADDGIEVTYTHSGNEEPDYYGDYYGEGYSTTPVHVGIFSNTVSNSGDDGIDVTNANYVWIDNNTVSNSGGDGITVNRDGSDEYDDDYYGDYYGIESAWSWDPFEYFPNNVVITNNSVSNSGDDGIEVNGYSQIEIGHNIVTDSGDDGIIVTNLIFDSIYQEPPLEAIFEISLIEPYIFDGVANINIHDNNVDNSGADGIQVDAFFDAYYDYGYVGTGHTNVSVTNNFVFDSGLAGNPSSSGLYIAGPDHGSVYVAGNTFQNNPVGATFESGTIDLTGPTNFFFGGDVGLFFNPWESQYWNLHLVDDDAPGYETFPSVGLPTNFGGTIGEQFFDGQSTYFVQLGNQAFWDGSLNEAIWLNGLNSTYVTPFGPVRPADTGGFVSADVFAFLESRFFHYPDTLSTGIFFFGSVPDDGIDIAQEDLFNRFNPYNGHIGSLNVTVLGLPNVGGGGGGGGPQNLDPAALNAIQTFAGGEEGGTPPTPEELNAIATAAGETSQNAPVNCWGDAMNAAGNGQVVNYSYGTGLDETVADAAACSAPF